MDTGLGRVGRNLVGLGGAGVVDVDGDDVLAGHHGQPQNSRLNFETRIAGLAGGGRFGRHVFGATTLKVK